MDQTELAVRRLGADGPPRRSEREAETTLRMFWRLIKVFTKKGADFQARVLLSAFYLVIVGPYALGVRLFADPLRLGADQAPRWLERDRPMPDTLPRVRRQF